MLCRGHALLAVRAPDRAITLSEDNIMFVTKKQAVALLAETMLPDQPIPDGWTGWIGSAATDETHTFEVTLAADTAYGYRYITMRRR